MNGGLDQVEVGVGKVHGLGDIVSKVVRTHGRTGCGGVKGRSRTAPRFRPEPLAGCMAGCRNREDGVGDGDWR